MPIRSPGPDGEGEAADRREVAVSRREPHRQVVDLQHQVGVGPAKCPGLESGGAHQRAGEQGSAALDPGQRFPGQVEGEPGQHDERAGAERGQRVLVHVLQTRAEQRAPVVAGRPHAQPEEAQRRDAQQRPAHRHRAGQRERLGDVRQHVKEQDADPADPQDPRGRNVVEPGDRGGQRLGQPREAGNHGDADAQDSSGGADPDDGVDEQCQQQPGKRHGGRDDARHQPPQPAGRGPPG